MRFRIDKVVRVNQDAFAIGKNGHQVTVLQGGLGEARTLESKTKPSHGCLDHQVRAIEPQRVGSWTQRDTVDSKPARPLQDVDVGKDQRLSQ